MDFYETPDVFFSRILLRKRPCDETRFPYARWKQGELVPGEGGQNTNVLHLQETCFTFESERKNGSRENEEASSQQQGAH